MKDQETQQKFVDLRARGRSFARIAEELQVSKRTLIEWSRKFQFEIRNQRAIELEALRERYLATREEQARQLGERLREVEAELATRKVSELSTPRLFALSESLRRQLQHATGGELRFSTPVQSIPTDEYHEEAQEWTA
jgi:transposase